MSKIVYIKMDQKIQAPQPDVHLGQIASVWCADKALLGKCLAVKLYSVEAGTPARMIGSMMDIVRRLQELDATIQVENLGENDFIIIYHPKEESRIYRWGKTILICMILFFGAAFAVVTFNNDVDVQKVFDRLYGLVIGTAPEGLYLLEWGYIIGLPIGIMGFYNHFSKHKRHADPTPLQMQMRQYESNINQTIIEDEARTQQRKEVRRGGR